MNRLQSVWKWLLLFFNVLAMITLGCRQPVPPPAKYSVPELEYRLISNFGEVFWCDPDFYPVARPEQEQIAALELFPIIKANTDEFSAIISHLDLPDKASYTDEEKLKIYRQHKMLIMAIQITPSDDAYNFSLRIGENQGERINGTITRTGDFKVVKREPSFNTCPICLARGTLIDTPHGPIPVEQLYTGMTIWTLSISGERISGTVLETTTTPVLKSFQLVRVTLKDGRSVTASPGHPAVGGEYLGDYRAGDILDGVLVVAVERLGYDGDTYDLLPSGGTGLYWANGILLKSTLATN